MLEKTAQNSAQTSNAAGQSGGAMELVDCRKRNSAFIQSLGGGVIMDVTSVEEAHIAQEAGAVAVMALERVPSDIRKQGGVARMSDPAMITAIKKAVSIPVMAKARIGHSAEARILEALGIDVIDESEVLTPADEQFHVDKTAFRTPFVCGCRNLGEALRRIEEGAAMLRTKGEAGTGNIVEAVRHMRAVQFQIGQLASLSKEKLLQAAHDMGVSFELVRETAQNAKLPVVNFAAGGVATPADAALMMELGSEGVFVGSGIFKSAEPFKRAQAIVQAVLHWNNPSILAQVSADLGDAMSGIDMRQLDCAQLPAARG